ncbi:MAG: FecCD family ABC transporter permease [Oliverpabstia sp.]
MEKSASYDRKSSILHTSLYIIVLAGLLVFLVFSILAAVTFGNADLSLKEVYSVIAYRLFHIESLAAYGEGAVHDVVWLIRLPRVLLALAVGMALSVCGVVMQAIVQNPLADPYVLGVSSGASLGATLAIMISVGSVFGSNSVGVMAFIGAMITSFAVLTVANMGGKATSGKLILAGMAISSVCSAFSNFIIYITNDKNASSEIVRWTMGSLGGASWDRVTIMFPLTLICALAFWTQYRKLNLMLLGDDVSITLGTDLHRFRTIYLILSSVLVGFAVYSAGMIGFVGLVIPHIIRILFGTDHKRLIPLSALLGASFLIWCDVLCRIILKNSEMPIGVLVAIIGAPCFIYLLVKKSYGFGGAK